MPLLPRAIACSALAATLALGGCSPAGDSPEVPASIPASPPTPIAGSTEVDTLAGARGPAVVRGDSAPGAIGVSANPLQWTGNDVVGRLRQAGLAPSLEGSVEQPSFGPRGLRVSVASGAGEVRAFLYGDANAVALAQRGFDPARVPGLAAGRTAMLLVDNNLAAIIISADAALGERIATALRTSPSGR